LHWPGLGGGDLATPVEDADIDLAWSHFAPLRSPERNPASESTGYRGRVPDEQDLESQLAELIRQFSSDPETATPTTVNSATPPVTTRKIEAALRLGVPARQAPGTPWPGERGDTRWRLSPSARALTRMGDEADLSQIIGRAAATAVAEEFLRIRPSGGRVWSDNDGHAVTVVGEQVVYLGRLPVTDGALAANTAAGGDLRSLIIRVLLDAPGSTGREIAYQLRWIGVATDKSRVNSLLYRDNTTFTGDGSTARRWRVSASAGGPTVASTRTAGSPKRKVGARTQGNAYVDLVSAPTPTRVREPRSPAEARRYREPALALMAWQTQAMQRWYDHGCQGIVEAVTGTGKTHLGLEAVEQARRDGQKSTVLVPSLDLQDQWIERFERFLPHLSVARVGGKKSGDPARSDVTIAVVNSAIRHDLASLSPDSLLVADEVHRYGASEFQYALRAKYERRLGLTATLERSGDDAVEEVLLPYFGGSIMTVGFDRAIREEVVAPFRLVMAPISMSEDEQAVYDTISHRLSIAMKVLRSEGVIKGGGADFVQQIARLGGAGGRIGRAARTAQSSMRERRRWLAGLSGKVDAVEELAELIEASMGTVVFTQSKDVAEEVAAALRGWHIAASALHSDMSVTERRQSLAGLAYGSLKVLAAPRLLDEGIDVPTVDLGIVMTASRSRRQMVQRLGRVIRKKDDGRPVTFVIIFAKDTVEDPSSGVHEGFFDLVGEVATNKVVLEPGWICSDVPA